MLETVHVVNVTEPEHLSNQERADRLVEASADLDTAAPQCNGLSYRLEIWDSDASRMLSLIGALRGEAVALAAYCAAIREFPGARLLLQADGRILADSGKAWTGQAAAPALEMRFSAREAQVIGLLVRGFSMKEVARTLGIAPRTVAFHKYKAMDTHGIRSNVELMDLAVRQGLLAATPPEETSGPTIR